jgi:ubiquinone/menaquinone biosynthesis C-methylase UbiE
MLESSHKAVVQESFTRQADVYAVIPTVTDPSRISRLIEAVNPDASARVLEVACGPGFLTLAFAERCREVLGVDLTDAPLAIAERNRRERGLSNVRFQPGDADRLPFLNGEFDVVLCRFAFHHFEDPARVLTEMVRVCRSQGQVAVEDLVTSEYRTRSDYQNRFEHLRDLSHTRALARTELLSMFTASGVEIEQLYSGELVQNLERWLTNSQTPPGQAAEVRAMIERDGREDLSGTRPYLENGQWFFRQPTLAVVARKLPI